MYELTGFIIATVTAVAIIAIAHFKDRAEEAERDKLAAYNDVIFLTKQNNLARDAEKEAKERLEQMNTMIEQQANRPVIISISPIQLEALADAIISAMDGRKKEYVN